MILFVITILKYQAAAFHNVWMNGRRPLQFENSVNQNRSEKDLVGFVVQP